MIMGVTVSKVLFGSSPFLWREDEDGTHVLKRTATLYIDYTKDGESFSGKVRFCGEATDGRGFRCDGLSVPKIFRWFLPSWKENNWLYNVAGVLHDWLYCTHGAYGRFSREECDDFFRCILRASGVGLIRAAIADKALERFAGGEDHWGNDSYHVAELARFEAFPCLL